MPDGVSAREAFYRRWPRPDPSDPSRSEWIWPDNDGLTAPMRSVPATDLGVLDTFTGLDGFEVYPDTAGFGTRSLPPDLLSFGRVRVQVRPIHPEVAHGQVAAVAGVVAPWFGQAGGAPRFGFVRGGVLSTVGELLWSGVLEVVGPGFLDPASVVDDATHDLPSRSARLGVRLGVDLVVDGMPSPAGTVLAEHYRLRVARDGRGAEVLHGWRGGVRPLVTRSIAECTGVALARAAVLAARRNG